jgi:hypothetical protein
MMIKSLKVETKYCKDLVIQETQIYHDDDIYEAMTQSVLNLQDEGVKKALIELGWSPPNKRNDSQTKK